MQNLWLKYIRLQFRNNTSLRLGTFDQKTGCPAVGYEEDWGRLLIDRNPNWSWDRIRLTQGERDELRAITPCGVGGL